MILIADIMEGCNIERDIRTCIFIKRRIDWRGSIGADTSENVCIELKLAGVMMKSILKVLVKRSCSCIESLRKEGKSNLRV